MRLSDTVRHQRDKRLAEYLDLRCNIYQLSMKWPGYSRQVTVGFLAGHNMPEAAKMMRRIDNALTNKKERFAIATAHAAAADQMQKMWEDLLDEGATKLWGRRWLVSDYKIALIGSEEFDDDLKNRLRLHALGASAHRSLARVWMHYATKLN